MLQFHLNQKTKIILGFASLSFLILGLAWSQIESPPSLSESKLQKPSAEALADAKTSSSEELLAKSYLLFYGACQSLQTAVANSNYKSVETAAAAENAIRFSSEANAYVAALLNKLTKQQSKTALEETDKTDEIKAILTIGTAADRCRQLAQSVAEVSRSSEKFNTGIAGQIVTSLGISQKVVQDSSGVSKVAYSANLNSLGGLGAIGTLATGWLSLPILGNSTGSQLDASTVAEAVFIPDSGVQFSFVSPPENNSVSNTDTNTNSNTATDSGYDYGTFSKASTEPSGSPTSCAPNSGNFCASPPNSCGLINPGRISCAGICTAIIPPENVCTAPTLIVSKETIYIKPGEKCQFNWQAENVKYCLFNTKKDTGESIRIITGGSQSFTSIPLSQRLTYAIDCYNGDYPPYQKISGSNLYEATDNAPTSPVASQTITCLPFRPDFENR
ncbi:MAG: hypothetical protein AAB597_03425 [Patescibacteria group bacterium]